MFFVPHKNKNTLATHVSTAGKQLGRQFVTRLLYMIEFEPGGDWTNEYIASDDKMYTVTAETEGAVLGIGVWRVK
jgi:hypothetical protein